MRRRVQRIKAHQCAAQFGHLQALQPSSGLYSWRLLPLPASCLKLPAAPCTGNALTSASPEGPATGDYSGGTSDACRFEEALPAPGDCLQGQRTLVSFSRWCCISPVPPGTFCRSLGGAKTTEAIRHNLWLVSFFPKSPNAAESSVPMIMSNRLSARDLALMSKRLETPGVVGGMH